VFTELAPLAAAGSTVVVATHDPRALTVADRVVELRDGIASAERSADGENYISLDGRGRLLLPPAARAVLSGSRARVVVDGQRVVITPVDET
jgi:energy-coupling factor transporter ATP-binding protein EcfA2